MEKWIHPYMGAEEFIKGKKRYCLWLVNASPLDIKSSKILYEKVESVRKFREESKAKTTNGYAKVPHCFAQMTQPEGVDYLIVPSVSSERRKYIPIGFLDANTISSNAVQIVPNASLYHFGVLTSNVHMAWMRTVAGRLKSDYRYSKEIVYNTFPWCNPTEEQKKRIEQTAQAILDARAKYPECSLAILYDDTITPPELRKAHQANDRAVMQAYGFDVKTMTESGCVAELTEIVFILDRSGSMAGLESDTIGGFNSMIEKQKKQDGGCYVSTVLFDDESEVLHDRVKLGDIPKMTDKDYTVRGCTALIDAIGGAIHHIGNIHKYARAEDVPEHTMFVITTDGQENASHRYTSDQVKKIIERQKEKYGWEFLFIGANIDAVETAARYGISKDRAVNYNADGEGTHILYESVAKAVCSVRASAPLSEDWSEDINADYQRRGKKKKIRGGIY